MYGGYSGIANGGMPELAMENLTGQAAVTYWPSQVSASMLSTDWSAGDLITFDTDANKAQYDIIGDHCYMFDGLTTTRGISSVGATLAYTPASGVLQVEHGASALAALTFQNSTLGAGNFHMVSDTGGTLLTHC